MAPIRESVAPAGRLTLSSSGNFLRAELEGLDKMLKSVQASQPLRKIGQVGLRLIQIRFGDDRAEDIGATGIEPASIAAILIILDVFYEHYSIGLKFSLTGHRVVEVC